MVIIWKRLGKFSKIGRRLIIRIVAFSSLVTLVITAIQLMMEYRAQRADLDTLLEEVQVFLPQMAASVWIFNDEQVTLGLEALVHLPAIERASIVTSNGEVRWKVRAGNGEDQVERVYPLTFNDRGTEQRIGTIHIGASLDAIHQRVLSQGITILISNAIKTFLVTAFMFFLFHTMVTRRIFDLATHVEHLFVPPATTNASMLEVTDAPGEPDDEIKVLREGFDALSRRLLMAARDLQDSNADLQRENEERKLAEQRLVLSVAELTETNVELERMTYVTAHDLREPTRSLANFSQLLERECGPVINEKGAEYLAFIRTEATRLYEEVNDLLNLKSFGRDTLNLQTVDCTKVVNGALLAVKPLIDQKQAIIEISDLPTLTADGAQLNRLFQNLLANALKYVPGTRQPEITLTAHQTPEAWRFEVRDNGIGIEEKYHAYIFEAFRRLHTRDQIPGTGMGLAICKNIVANHGGLIWVESSSDQGTCFAFTIPFGKD
ncbi:putative Two-component histidine kinase [Magnetospira sp. QH-2]|nr:putative Two-component histidine kinase [Magnetospira sp. QH-2]